VTVMTNFYLKFLKDEKEFELSPIKVAGLVNTAKKMVEFTQVILDLLPLVKD